jgi:hypothetical protein
LIPNLAHFEKKNVASYYAKLGLKGKFSFSHFRENLFSFSRKFLNEN